MVSIKDVAQLAGVSVSTVSRVISGKIPVSDETATRVREAIRELDFHPNLLAAGLRSKSGNLIGLIVPDILNESFALISRFTEENAEQKGFTLIVGNTNEDPTREERFIRDLIRRHVDGIILLRVSHESRAFEIIERSKVPAVVVDRTIESEEAPSVVMDNYRAGEMVAEHLISLGHTRFACVTGPMNIAIVRERYMGFQETIEKNGMALEQECVIEGDFKYESGIEAIRRLVSHRERFTCLWAHNDLMAVGAMNELRRRKIPVPEAVSVVGIDNINIARMVTPGLTTIAQPFGEMCQAAVELILRMRDGEELRGSSVSFQPRLVVRETTARPL